MQIVNFPTSRDIYIEVDGQKVAVVESYKAKATRDTKLIEAFGEQAPVGIVIGTSKYTIELSRVYVTDGALNDNINFHDLEDFNLVIVKPSGRTIYTGCQWQSLNEDATINDVVLEQVVIVARKRLEQA